MSVLMQNKYIYLLEPLYFYMTYFVRLQILNNDNPA